MDLGERVTRVETIIEGQTSKLDEISTDVKSLLASRNEFRGSWKAVVAAATAAGAIAEWLFHLVRGH